MKAKVDEGPRKRRRQSRNLLRKLRSYRVPIIVGTIVVGIFVVSTLTVPKFFPNDSPAHIPSAAEDSIEYFDIPRSFNIPSSLPEHSGECSDLEFIVNHQDSTVTADERILALKENTSIVMYVTASDYNPIDSHLSIRPHTYHSALRISESGYFITQASRAMDFLKNPETKNALVLVYHPKSGQFYMIREIVPYHERDIAFLNGDIGIPTLPIRGIEFRKTPMQDGEEIYMTPATIERQQKSDDEFVDSVHFLDTRNGTLVPRDEVSSVDSGNEPQYIDQHIIFGMKIFPGVNGLHAFDKNGRVVGMTTKDLEITAPGGLYDGTQIASIRSIASLARKCYDNRTHLPLRFEFSNLNEAR